LVVCEHAASAPQLAHLRGIAFLLFAKYFSKYVRPAFYFGKEFGRADFPHLQDPLLLFLYATTTLSFAPTLQS
jgi:hypothetical protein